MAHDLLDLVVRANLVLGGAIALVLLARAPMRRVFGARISYALWLIPPLAAATCFLPTRTQVVTVADTPSAFPISFAPPTVPAEHHVLNLPLILLSVWIGGALLLLSIFALRQSRFVKSLGRLVLRRDFGGRVFGAESEAGPAVVGALWPVIVTPADFEKRYSSEERAIVLAHEQAHLAQGDPLINAAVALLQCVAWFNPFVHIAARALRVDQELACDAAVIARKPQTRRLYAEAMLKAHAAPLHGPLVCAWPAPSLNPLKERIAMLKRNPPNRLQLALGASVVVLATLGVCTSAWTAQPAKFVVMKVHGGPDLAPKPMSVVKLDGDDAQASGPPDASDADNAIAAVDDDSADTADLAGAPDGDSFNSEEFNQNVQRLVHNAMREARADRAGALTPQQRVEIQRQIQAQAAQVRVQAMAQARAAVAQARVEVHQAQIQAHQAAMQARQAQNAHQGASIELEDASQQLREHAMQLAQAALSEDDHMSDAERSAREADIEREAQRVAELALRTAQVALDHVDVGDRGDSDAHDDQDAHAH